jgi:hypothetical protein
MRSASSTAAANRRQRVTRGRPTILSRRRRATRHSQAGNLARKCGLHFRRFKRLARGSHADVESGRELPLPAVHNRHYRRARCCPIRLIPRAPLSSRHRSGASNGPGATWVAGRGDGVSSCVMRYLPLAGQPERGPRAMSEARADRRDTLCEQKASGCATTGASARRLSVVCHAEAQAGGVGTAALRTRPPARPDASTKLVLVLPLFVEDSQSHTCSRRRDSSTAAAAAMASQAASREPLTSWRRPGRCDAGHVAGPTGSQPLRAQRQAAGVWLGAAQMYVV